MSTRTVYTCDLCGQDYEADARGHAKRHTFKQLLGKSGTWPYDAHEDRARVEITLDQQGSLAAASMSVVDLCHACWKIEATAALGGMAVALGLPLKVVTTCPQCQGAYAPGSMHFCKAVRP